MNCPDHLNCPCVLLALTVTVTTDVQRDDQESSGLQAKPQRLHG